MVSSLCARARVDALESLKLELSLLLGRCKFLHNSVVSMDLCIGLSDFDEVALTRLACLHCSVTHLDFHLALISELVSDRVRHGSLRPVSAAETSISVRNAARKVSLTLCLDLKVVISSLSTVGLNMKRSFR